ncbi:9811_t:CDS:1, partial [Funneliformis geosporum]
VKLSFAFDHSNFATYYLFENVPEINKKGINNILSFYESDKSHFEQVLLQNIYKTKTQVVTRRHSQDINHYTYTQLENMKKQKDSQV